MVTVNAQPNLTKDNLYRAGMDQPPANNDTLRTAPYCRQMLRQLNQNGARSDIGYQFPLDRPGSGEQYVYLRGTGAGWPRGGF